uniref:Uncharacterized protein n=1 Tax=viral metagenome TaxID=1070528 RepID=A0A6C0JQZ8_9ZZZZ
MSLKLYLICQKEVHVEDWSSYYSGAVVVAKNQKDAVRIHPSGEAHWNDKNNTWLDNEGEIVSFNEWPTLKDITCSLVSNTVEPTYSSHGQVVCSSYHPGG